jgi:glycosyltransferase involved in cell wall biosynthesis
VDATPERRVLFLCAALDAGGAERHWASLMPALCDRGLAVRLVALEGGGRALEQLRAQGVPVRELGRSGVASLRALPSVLAEGQGRPAVIVTFGYNAHALGALAARTLGIPHILNWHRQAGWQMSPVEAGAVRLAARLGAGAIAVTAAQLPDLHGLGFRASRLRVVPNGTSARGTGAGRSSMRGELGLPAKGLVAVLVARLRPEKRIVDFIDACARLRHELPDLRGVVVGDGPQAEELGHHAAEQDAPVHFAGYQADPTRWMVAADVVCLTSTHEALPMVLVEALACGRPCITTAVGGVGEIVEDGANGFVVAREDVPGLVRALRRLAMDPALRERMGAESLTRWRLSFSLDAMVVAYADLLRSVEGMPVTFAG